MTPTAINKTIVWGNADTSPLNIANTGNKALAYQVGEAPLWKESFEGSFPPAGWTVQNFGGTCVWDSTANTGYPNHTGGTGQAADANSDNCGSGTTMDTMLVSPAIDLSLAGTASVSFLTDYYPFQATDAGYVGVSTNGGNSWSLLYVYSGTTRITEKRVLDLSAFVGNKDVRLAFEYVAPGWDWWWQIDDVTVLASSSWLSWTNGSGSVPAGSSVDVGVTLDSKKVAKPGTYTSELIITSDDVLTPTVNVPVTMVVTDSPAQVRIYGTVMGNRSLAGGPEPLGGATVQGFPIVNPAGDPSFTTTTAADGTYTAYLAPWLVPAGTTGYEIDVSKPGYLPDLYLSVINPGDIISHDVTLRAYASNLIVDPRVRSAKCWIGTAAPPCR